MSTLVSQLHDLPPTAAMPFTASAPRPARELQFTFDLHSGALRREVGDVLADRMSQVGLDVSWVDARHGVMGRRRRFTVRGPRETVQRLIAELGRDLGWQPGAVGLPGRA